MRRFFVNESDIVGNEIYIIDREDIKHISKVLRMEEGDNLLISDTVRFEYKCEILTMDKDQVICSIQEKNFFSSEPRVKVTLFQGVPKQGKMETIIQKCVELGIHKIVPVFTSRTVVVDKEGKTQNKVDRWQKISNEAVKQCQRGIQPKIDSPIDFKELIKVLKSLNSKDHLVLFPYENEENLTIKDVLRKPWNGIENISIIIGPEGGFSEDEAQSIKCAGGYCVTLGKRILRTETAGMTALAVVMYEFEL